MPDFLHDWYPDGHQQALWRAATLVEHDRGANVEVGAFEGQSAYRLAHWFDHLICVDPWGDQSAGADRPDPGATNVYQRFVSNMREAPVPVIRFRCGWEQFFQVFDGPLQFLHIDAVHEYAHVKGNIEAALPYAVPGAVFCGHDYCDRWPGVKQAVDEIFPNRVVDEWVWSVRL